jgi:hypothetical protein
VNDLCSSSHFYCRTADFEVRRPFELNKRQYAIFRSSPSATLPCSFQTEFSLENDQVLALIDTSSVLIGPHPDEATELILTAAVRLPSWQHDSF